MIGPNYSEKCTKLPNTWDTDTSMPGVYIRGVPLYMNVIKGEKVNAIKYSSLQVRESFGLPDDSSPLTTATVACFLIQEGADDSLCNNQGLSPVEVCSPVVASMVMTFRDALATKMYYR